MTTSSIVGQGLNERPFVLSNGEVYRDLLTIQASQAVAKFGERYQPSQTNRVRIFYL